MKTLLSILLLLISLEFSEILLAEEGYQCTSAVKLSSTYETGNCIVRDGNGNIYIIGQNNGTASIFISKMNEPVWTHTYSGAMEWGNSITVDETGQIYVSGTFQGSVNFGPFNLTAAGVTDVFILKINPADGNVVIAVSAGGANSDEGFSITCGSGGVYVTGSFSETAEFGSGNIIYSFGCSDIFISKLTYNLVFAWTVNAGGIGEDIGKAIKYSSDKIYITGSFYNNAAFPGFGNLSGFGQADAFVAQYDIVQGKFIWAIKGGGVSSFECGNALDVANGNVYVTGVYNSNPSQFGTINLPNFGNADIFIASLNVNNGNINWANGFGGLSDTDSGLGIVYDNGIHVTGCFAQTLTINGIDMQSSGGTDIFFLDIDDVGVVKAIKKCGGSGDDVVYSISKGLYYTGYFHNWARFGKYQLTTSFGPRRAVFGQMSTIPNGEHTWFGTYNNNWNNNRNWDCGKPSINEDVFVPNVTTESGKFPKVNDTQLCNNIEIFENAKLQIILQGNLSCNNIINNHLFKILNGGTATVTNLILNHDSIINSNDLTIGSVINNSIVVLDNNSVLNVNQTITNNPFGKLLAREGAGLIFCNVTSQIINEGEIQATGTSELPVTFSTPNNTIFWSGIRIQNIASESSPVLKYCIFERSAGAGLAPDFNGGALYIKNSPNILFENCEFRNCQTPNNGGAIYVYNSDITINNCYFHGNTANNGGGIYIDSTTLKMESDKIEYNIANNNGGGIFLNNSNPEYLKNLLVDKNDAANNGDGIYCDNSNPKFENATIAENWGNGLDIFNCNPVFTSCIVWDNLNNGLPGGLNVTYSDVQGGIYPDPGNTNISVNPIFGGPRGLYDIDPLSPCKDLGNLNPLPPFPLNDIFGQTRISNGRIDIGVAEIQVVPSPIKTWDKGGDGMNWFDPDNWSPDGIPTEEEVVEIQSGNTILLNNIDVALTKDLTIFPGSTLIIIPEAGLSTYGLFTNNGSLIISSNGDGYSGSFIDLGGIAGTGFFEFDRDLICSGTSPGSSDPYGWHYLSVPFDGFTTDGLYDYFVNAWDQPTGMWTKFDPWSSFGPCTQWPTTPLNTLDAWSINFDNTYPDNCNPPLPQGTGHQVEFVCGVSGVHTGPYSKPFGYGATGYQMWNLIGNPYPSGLAMDQISWPAELVAGAAYYDGCAGNYVYWTPATGPYTMAPTLGFFTEATAPGVFSLTGAERAHDADWFWKSDLTNMLKLQASGNGGTDVTTVRFMDNVTAGFDRNGDFHKLISGKDYLPQIYTYAGDDMLAINALPETESVPMGFVANGSGTYTLEATETSDFSQVFLEDKFTGTVTDLLMESYSFSYQEGENPDRFVIHFKDVPVNNGEEPEISVFSDQNNVVIGNTGNLEGNIGIYNLVGQCIRSVGLENGTNTIPLDGVNGIYIVKVNTESGVVNKKVYIQ